MPQRLGLLLLGLLLLAGAVHGPMHEEGHDCGPLSLCDAGVVLMVVSLALGLLLLLVAVPMDRPVRVDVVSEPQRRRSIGRAPPR